MTYYSQETAYESDNPHDEIDQAEAAADLRDEEQRQEDFDDD